MTKMTVTLDNGQSFEYFLADPNMVKTHFETISASGYTMEDASGEKFHHPPHRIALIRSMVVAEVGSC